MCVNTEKKWQHIGKGTRWQTPWAGSARSFPWKTRGALPIFGQHGRTHQPCPREGQDIEGKEAGSLPCLSPWGKSLSHSEPQPPQLKTVGLITVRIAASMAVMKTQWERKRGSDL